MGIPQDCVSHSVSCTLPDEIDYYRVVTCETDTPSMILRACTVTRNALECFLEAFQRKSVNSAG